MEMHSTLIYKNYLIKNKLRVFLVRFNELYNNIDEFAHIKLRNSKMLLVLDFCMLCN